MNVSNKPFSYLALPAFGAVFLASCQQAKDGGKSDLPAGVVSQLDKVTEEELSRASYQIHKYGPVKAYVIALTGDLCGSGGCETFILVEKDGQVKKIYDDLAGYVDVDEDFPDQLRFTIGRGGLACGKPYNSAPCSLVITWPKGSASWKR